MLSDVPACSALLNAVRSPVIIEWTGDSSPDPRDHVEVSTDRVRTWFASADRALDASPEAIGSAFLLTATRRHRPIRIVDRPVSAEWLAGVVQLMEVWHEWWGYPVLEPEVDVRRESRARAPETGICFTGGLDSFYSLLASDPKPDTLVFVHGYDIPLEDDQRMTAWSERMSSVAGALGLRQVRIRSNLRSHPLVTASHWDRAHGGALAAAGHLLASTIGTLLIASSAPTRYGYSWGSHERIDHLWSSDRLRVVHHGASCSRIEKLRAIADEPLAQQHLRVCWENRTADGNCSACDKCVCTMVTIAACGDPAAFVSFDWSVPLQQRLERIRSTRFVRTYGELLELPMPETQRVAIERLLRRTALPNRLRAAWHRWRG